jgi:hypothetical protein
MFKIITSIWIIVLLTEGCATKRVVVRNCTDIDNFGKYKICDLVIDK